MRRQCPDIDTLTYTMNYSRTVKYCVGLITLTCLSSPVFADALDQSLSTAIDQRMAKLLARHWDQAGSPPPEQDSMFMGWMAAILAPDFSAATEENEEEKQPSPIPVTHPSTLPTPSIPVPQI
jgi:hypothetical protein